MSNCVRNSRTKNYQNLIIGFQVTVENVVDAFLGHSVYMLLSVDTRYSNPFIRIIFAFDVYYQCVVQAEKIGDWTLPETPRTVRV